MDSDYCDSLIELIEKQYLVSFDFEPLNDLHSWGFVLDCNETFTLINFFDRDTYSLDGYSIFYNKDVSEYWVYTTEENYLETKYIKLKCIKPKPIRAVKIESLSTIIESISNSFSVMKVYRDRLAANGAVIGRLVELKENTFKLLSVRNDAVWKEVPSRFRIKDITRIDFDTKYEKILLEVAAEYK